MSLDYRLSKVRNTNKELDTYIGGRIKCRRSMLGMSQDKLGSHLGITFQQIQKYEKGANRVSASMLHQISNILSVDITYFTNGFDGRKMLQETNSSAYAADAAKRKESADLLKAYYKIDDQSIRKKILKLVKTFSSATKKANDLLVENWD